MPKKPPKSAFWIFMLDYKKVCERNGEKFPEGVRNETLMKKAGLEWAALPKDMRKPYEDRAKQEKAIAKLDTACKETNMHRTFASIDQLNMQEKEAKNTMNQWIEKKVQSLSTKKHLSEYKMYLIHVNYFCISASGCYLPAELALAEFCLGKGVTNVYHTMVDPGAMPMGYKLDAIQKSQQTHKIPVEKDVGEKNFYKIFTDIKKFLEPGRDANDGKYPPMFTMEDNVALNTSFSCAINVIKTLCNSMPSEDDPDRYPVYSLEKLFFELKNASARMNNEFGRRFPAISYARTQLQRDNVFDFSSFIACEFHVKEDFVQY